MRTVTADDGVAIAYDVFGRHDREPVLLIQGLGTDSRGWAFQRWAFGRRYRCITVDNRGMGHSERPPGPYDLDQMVRDALACLDAEGIERAHVVGASMGGMTSLMAQGMSPERQLFAAVVLAVVAVDRTNAMTLLGAHLFFWGRVAYAVCYLGGIKFLRTASWSVAILGIVLILIQLF